MKIIQSQQFRSVPEVNQDEDMVRVVVDMTKREWYKFERKIRIEDKRKSTLSIETTTDSIDHETTNTNRT